MVLYDCDDMQVAQHNTLLQGKRNLKIKEDVSSKKRHFKNNNY